MPLYWYTPSGRDRWEIILVFGRFYQAWHWKRVFFNRLSLLSGMFSATLAEDENCQCHQERQTYYLSLFNSMWRISLWLVISCNRTCSSGNLGYAHFSFRRNIISLWNLLRFLFYITRKAHTESDFANWFLEIFLNKIMYILIAL